jgi:flavorubredoxin
MATIDEVAPDIFRVNLGALPGDPITTSFFLIRDDQPTLVETGYRKTFDEAWDAVRRLVDPTTLRYVVVPHLEGDESGALNHFLERAPRAQAVGSPIGAAVNLSDFAIREPLAVDDSDAFDLGSHQLRFLITPYVHQWDSMLAYDATTRTVFCSDVFISLGEGPAVTDRDESDAMLDGTG